MGRTFLPGLTTDAMRRIRNHPQPLLHDLSTTLLANRFARRSWHSLGNRTMIPSGIVPPHPVPTQNGEGGNWGKHHEYLDIIEYTTIRRRLRVS